MSKLGVLNFVKAAHQLRNAQLDTVEGLELFLISWFCIKFNTTPNDQRLLDMTLEELITTFYIHRMQEDPETVARLVDDEDGYEKWLKEEMGDEYLSDDDMIEGMVQYENNQKDKRKAKDAEFKRKLEELPDRITTDFSVLGSEDET